MLRIWGPHLSANVRRLEPPARASRQMLWAHGMIVDDGIMCSKGARAGGGREGTAATASSNKLLAARVALSLSLSRSSSRPRPPTP